MGGIERALVVLANYFSDCGYKITFLSCLKGNHFYSLNNQIQLIELKYIHKGGLLSGLIFYPRLICFIREQVKKANPDFVLAFGDQFSPMVLLALYGTKYPIYISDRTSPDYKFNFPIPQLKKWLYPKSAGFIAQTQRAADYKLKQFNNKLNIKVLPNAIRDIKLYPEIKREKIILYVGRFAWEKGPDRLIRAFAGINERLGWQLHMAGSGPLLIPMQQLSKELGIENEIRFLGSIKDVDLLYAKASVYVLPSKLEGFPNALCEAMSAGLPVLCFDCIPHEEIITNGITGIVVPDSNLSQLSNELVKLMNNEDLRIKMGTEAKCICQNLKVEYIGKQVAEFILAQ